jgi:hypothetical protein
VIQPSVMDRGGRTGTLLALHRVSGPRPVGRSSGINSERSGEARRIDPTSLSGRKRRNADVRPPATRYYELRRSVLGASLKSVAGDGFWRLC